MHEVIVSMRLLALALLPFLALTAPAGDWPTYMHDNARSGVTAEKLPLPLAPLWTYRPPAEPQPAWSRPQPGLNELPKLNFDDAFHVALAGEMVFFGSSVDNGVHALDAATGARRWTCFTDGPVRLAPTFAGGRLYAGSDDGTLYCLDARDGKPVWTTRPFQGRTRILGAGRMMSLWPVRTGPLVDGGAVYFGSGVFPARGTALVALDAADGRPLWRTNGVPKESYVFLAPMGYLLASPTQVIVPNGRSTPLAYDRKDGAVHAAMERSLDAVSQKGVVSGGYGILIGDRFYMGSQNVLHGYSAEGKHLDTVNKTSQLIAAPDRLFSLAGTSPAFGRTVEEKAHVVSCYAVNPAQRDVRLGALPKTALKWTWSAPRLQVMIAAGSQLVVGGENEVTVLDDETGKPVWKAPVEGRARGLAVANGRLVVSTDRGRLHAFGTGPAAPAAEAVSREPFAAQPARAALAEAVAKEAGVTNGYGLVAGPDAPALALDLARRTGLLMHALETDPARARAAREALLAAGVYGSKVLVDVADPAGTNGLPYPPYFANLIVSTAPAASRDLLRHLKPCGGVLAAAGQAGPAFAAAGPVTPFGAPGGAEGFRLVRGSLPGARDWTHQFGDAGNTGSSDDERVRGRLEVLWYGEPGPDRMQDRHAQSEAPLMLDGRLYIQGVRAAAKQPVLMCFDAYNGVQYWEQAVPDAVRLYALNSSGNLAVSRDGLFVALKNRCLQMKLADGGVSRTFEVPAGLAPDPVTWGCVAVADGRLVGSASTAYQFSGAVFAFDLKSGEPAWRYAGGVIRNATLAVSGGRVFFVEQRGRKKPPVVLNALEALEQAKTAERLGQPAPPKPAPETNTAFTVVALDLATGREVWAKTVDLTRCGRFGGNLTLQAKDGVLLLAGNYNGYGRPKGDEDTRRGLALAAADGSVLWDRTIGNRIRPVLVKDKIIARPKAFLLKTGEPAMKAGVTKKLPWAVQNSGACGQVSASGWLFFYRDGHTAVADVETGGRVMTFLGLRPGCLINIIPAGGVVAQVEGSSGCACGHALQGTVAFVPQGAE